MAANTSNTSQAVENLIAANPPQSNQSMTALEQAQNIVNPGSVTPAASQLPPQGMALGPNNPAAAAWGPALGANQGLTAGMFPGYEPPVIYYNMPIPHPPFFSLSPQAFPNPNYNAVQNSVREAQHLGLTPNTTGQQNNAINQEGRVTLTPENIDEGTLPELGGETPIPSNVSSEVDNLIKESQEVVDEIKINTPPEAPPVEPVQEIVKPPAPITPTELVLAAQAHCEQSAETGTPEINIEIINNIDFQATTNFSASLSAQAFATASAVAGMEDFFKKGCMDPDAINFDPDANIPDPGSCEYLPPDPVKGCTDPTALNYDPDATEDDGSCQFAPVLPPIPPMSQFLDSHGQVIFEVPKELVEDEGMVDLPKGNTVKITATRDLVNPKAKNPIVRPAPLPEDIQSDLILTTEEMTVSTRKQIRKQLITGQLASDVVEEGEKDVIIRNVPKDTKVVRNNGGAILITTNTPIVKASLQSQAFIYEDYRKAIDTSFNELVGKM